MMIPRYPTSSSSSSCLPPHLERPVPPCMLNKCNATPDDHDDECICIILRDDNQQSPKQMTHQLPRHSSNNVKPPTTTKGTKRKKHVWFPSKDHELSEVIPVVAAMEHPLFEQLTTPTRKTHLWYNVSEVRHLWAEELAENQNFDHWQKGWYNLCWLFSSLSSPSFSWSVYLDQAMERQGLCWRGLEREQSQPQPSVPSSSTTTLPTSATSTWTDAEMKRIRKIIKSVVSASSSSGSGNNAESGVAELAMSLSQSDREGALERGRQDEAYAAACYSNQLHRLSSEHTTQLQPLLVQSPHVHSTTTATTTAAARASLVKCGGRLCCQVLAVLVYLKLMMSLVTFLVYIPY